ncbi:MAG: ribosome small subunit-dependent GTPase A [Thermoanaerobaculales bacterium]|nr:ribosome small subunit-dependent GTPase A [Thermoanaerobaculales bacterium]
MELIEGTIIAIHGGLIRVRTGETIQLVSSRRRLNWEGGAPEVSRLVVGDVVSLEMTGSDGVVVAVRSRKTSLLRRAASSRRPQVLAANIDQALLVFAARYPEPKQGLLDRFLVACHHAGIEPVITINKIDQGTDAVESWLPTYENLGYAVQRVSAQTAWGLGGIKRLLPNRTTLFCGPSGSGKSSLLNRVYPGFRLAVGSLSDGSGKGRHTTTRAELMPLPFGGFVIDTPGLREFGLWDLDSQSLQAAFPEIEANRNACRFPNCSHVHEPDCAVRTAVQERAISSARYHSYCTLLEETS